MPSEVTWNVPCVTFERTNVKSVSCFGSVARKVEGASTVALPPDTENEAAVTTGGEEEGTKAVTMMGG